MKRCVIVGGGEIKKIDYARSLLREDDFLIAADRGYEHCVKMGVQPQLLLGDFDSYRGDLPKEIPVYTYPVEKDDTDTMLAIKEALKQGYTDLLLLGMSGGRLDHTLANIQSVVYAVCHGAKACIMDEDLYLTALCGKQQVTVPYREGFVVSVFSHSDVCRGVTLKDLYYSLENGKIDNRFPLGCSNHFLPGKDGEISISEGIAVVLSTREQ